MNPALEAEDDLPNARPGAPPGLSWTRIVDFRRKDRLTIIPMSLLAAVGGWVWLGPWIAAGWLIASLAAVAMSQATTGPIAEGKIRLGRPEIAVAALTAVQASIYCLLPFLLIAEAPRTGFAAGLIMLGAVTLSGGDELVISRPVGWVSIAICILTFVAALLWQGDTAHWGETLLAILAAAGFVGYVVQAAFKRIDLDRRMALALQAAIDKEHEAAVANAAKSTFLTTISHEIRTPLNGVLGMAQAMAAEGLPEAQRRRLDVIRRSGEALTDILNDVLDLSKIEAGQLDIEHLAFELDEVLEAGVATFTHRAAEKGLDLRLQIATDAAGAYLGDPMRVRQVVYNLISNAVKFTAEGRVEIIAERVEGQVRIAVSDTGPGIAEAAQGRLFRKFEQLDASTTRRHGGTGLGLAICRELCELMGGTISVQSAPGVGSTFAISLPLERASSNAKQALTAIERHAPQTDGLRILAAEDNEVNRLVLTALLAQIGVEPVVVDNGALAVEAWSHGNWDVVLMDVQMPVMDGIAAVGEIRRLELAKGLPRTPVIALTANAMTHQVAELMAAGMDAHVSKPINVADLFAAIEHVVSTPVDDMNAIDHDRAMAATVGRQ